MTHYRANHPASPHRILPLLQLPSLTFRKKQFPLSLLLHNSSQTLFMLQSKHARVTTTSHQFSCFHKNQRKLLSFLPSEFANLVLLWLSLNPITIQKSDPCCSAPNLPGLPSQCMETNRRWSWAAARLTGVPTVWAKKRSILLGSDTD